MRRLGQARSTLRGFKGGRFETMWVNQEQWGEGHGNLWAYVRWDPQNDPRHNALVVMNLTENTWTNVELHSRDADSLKLSDLGWTSGTVKDYLSGTEYQIHDSAITVDVPARGGKSGCLSAECPNHLSKKAFSKDAAPHAAPNSVRSEKACI